MRKRRFTLVYVAGLSLITAYAGACAGGETRPDVGSGGDGGDGGSVNTGGAGGSGGEAGAGGVGGSGGGQGGSGGGAGAGGEPPTGDGQPAKNPLPYPDPPYGYAIGSTLENYKFFGFVDASADNMNPQTIELAAFYNPTGLEVFPPGSPYGEGKPKPTTLLIHVAALWAAPSDYEANMVLPPLYAKYKPCGGEFLQLIVDGPTPGKPGSMANLVSWTTKHKINYPAALDPANKLKPLFEADAYPANMIIDTRKMTLVKSLAGVPDNTFWATFEQVMDNAACIN